MFREKRRDLERVVERIVRDVSDEIASLVESAVSPLKFATFISPEGYRRPVADTYVDGEEVVAVFELPGASKDSISLTVRESEIEVEALFSEEVLKSADKYPPLRNAKGYKRILQLPRRVEAGAAKAVYRDGVLVVRIPFEKPKGVAVKIE